MRAHRPPPPRRERSRGRYVGHPKPRGSSHRVSPGPPCKRQTRDRRRLSLTCKEHQPSTEQGAVQSARSLAIAIRLGTSCWTRLVAPNCCEGEGSRPEILDHLSSS